MGLPLPLVPERVRPNVQFPSPKACDIDLRSVTLQQRPAAVAEHCKVFCLALDHKSHGISAVFVGAWGALRAI